MAKTGADTQNYILGKGKLYIDRLDSSGNKTGEIEIGNCPSVALTPTIETLDHFESMSGIREKDKSVNTSIGYNIKFTTDEYSRENVKMAILGETEGTLTQSSGSQTNAVVTAYHDKWVKLPHRLIDSVSVTNVAGSTHYTLDTDYKLDTTIGRIKVLSSGSITDEQTLHVDYNYSALEYPQLSGVEITDIDAFVRFIGDPAVGPKYELEVWHVKLRPTGDFNLISDDWGTIDFEGELEKDDADHPDDPWFKIYDKTSNLAAAS